MSLSDIRTVYCKEILEVIRDRRMMFMYVVLPCLAFPLLLSGVAHFFVLQTVTKSQNKTKICFAGDSEALRPYLNDFEDFTVTDVPDADSRSQLRVGKIDAIVRVPGNFEQAIESGKPPSVGVQVRNLVADMDTVEALTNALENVREKMIDERLSGVGINNSWLGIPIEHQRFASTQARINQLLSMGLPMSLVYLVLIVSATPALDMVTGEKERGSLSALLSTAISRKDIMVAKLAAVSTIGFLVVVMTLASSAFVLNHFSEWHVHLVAPAAALVWTAIFLVPLILVVSAACLWMSAYSRNFQQGQSYLTGSFLIILVLCALGAMPAEHTPPALYLIPVTNVCLCLKQCFEGTYSWPFIGMTFGSSCLYAIFLCSLATGLLERENVVFAVQSPPRLRKDFKRAVAGLYAFVFILMFYIGQTWQAESGLGGIAATQWFLIAPSAVLFIKFLGQPLAATLSLKRTSWKLIVGAILLAPLTVLIGSGIAYVQNGLLPMPEAFEKIMTSFIIPKDKPAWLIILAVALTPAICEELMFRGAILGLLRKSMKPLPLCIWVGVLFGIFHLSTYRVVPTSLLGIALAAIVWRSGSIFPAMCLHAAHNALTTATVIYHIEPAPQMIGMALPVVLLGAFLMWSGLKDTRPPDSNVRGQRESEVRTEPGTQDEKSTASSQPATQDEKSAASSGPGTQDEKSAASSGPGTQDEKSAASSGPGTQDEMSAASSGPGTQDKSAASSEPAMQDEKSAASSGPGTQDESAGPGTQDEKSTASSQPATQDENTADLGAGRGIMERLKTIGSKAETRDRKG